MGLPRDQWHTVSCTCFRNVYHALPHRALSALGYIDSTARAITQSPETLIEYHALPHRALSALGYIDSTARAITQSPETLIEYHALPHRALSALGYIDSTARAITQSPETLIEYHALPHRAVSAHGDIDWTIAEVYVFVYTDGVIFFYILRDRRQSCMCYSVMRSALPSSLF